ncbi:hypothetical protein B0H13DRAFT_1867097 [Mycena leptocephala]|nr:hypothetical protein B0H13DRAFT_1867097 [Mycena leptocephala]
MDNKHQADLDFFPDLRSRHAVPHSDLQVGLGSQNPANTIRSWSPQRMARDFVLVSCCKAQNMPRCMPGSSEIGGRESPIDFRRKERAFQKSSTRNEPQSLNLLMEKSSSQWTFMVIESEADEEEANGDGAEAAADDANLVGTVQVWLLHSYFKASPERFTSIHFLYFVQHLRAACSDVFYFKLDFSWFLVAGQASPTGQKETATGQATQLILIPQNPNGSRNLPVNTILMQLQKIKVEAKLRKRVQMKADSSVFAGIIYELEDQDED